MKIFVVGLGSMGKRRIKILNDLFPEYSITGIDKRVDRRADVEKLGVDTFSDYENAFSTIKPDVVFACTPPLLHKDIVIHALENNAHTFSEINLSNEGYRKIMRSKKKYIAFLSSTMLYRKEIKQIIQLTEKKHLWSYRYHIGQYLPDWHPWENINEYFVSDKRTNACREILAIELPWIVKTFGKISKISAIAGKISDLELSYPDTYQVVLKHNNGCIGCLSIDVISRIPTRSLEVYSDLEYIKWDGTPQSLCKYDPLNKILTPVETPDKIINDPNYAPFIAENAYIEEIQTFFDLINGKNDSKLEIYTYTDDLYTLKIIDSIETRAIT